MRKTVHLFLVAGALSLASLGVASPALAGTSHNSAHVASGGQSTSRPVQGHHDCPPWRFPNCALPFYDVDRVVTPDINVYVGNACKNMGFNSSIIVTNQNYQGSNGHPWSRGTYRCYNQ
jgi:hypothetical protein